MTRRERFCAINPQLPIYTVHDAEFAPYGRVVEGVDVAELCRVAAAYDPLPREPFVYETSVPALEALDGARALRECCWGGADIQVGLGRGRARRLDALEWHTCGETSVAVTDMVLLLADRRELCGGWLDSDRVRAFYLAAGEVADLYATTLHYCPVQIDGNGLSCIVVLPRGTNEPLPAPARDPLLFARNKWLFAHTDCRELLAQGAVPGIRGVNWTFASLPAEGGAT